MKKPKMILFDYGQTLVNEAKFDGVKGTEAVMKFAVRNERQLTAEEVQDRANEIKRELGRFDPSRRHLFQIEIPNHMFTRYLYESLGIELSLKPEEIDRIFWDAASPGKPTDGIENFLAFLRRRGIRTAVVSNISYAGQVVEQRINSVIPDNDFEFMIATSEYMYRKPHPGIFQLALTKAGLSAEDVWFVGDQYECDIVGAGNAGMFPVWYLGATDIPYTKHEDVLTIKDWEELIRRLQG